MIPPSDGLASNDPLDFIRRAARLAQSDKAVPSKDVNAAIDRMVRDDSADDADSFGVDMSADTPPALDSLGDDSDMNHTADSPSRGTVSEIDFSVDSTIELPEGDLSGADESGEPSLSDPTASSSRARNSSRQTILATPLYRPTRRPPMAVLQLYDDDQRTYESVRIRQTPFVIGRQDGDLVVGHERQMSRRHARIDRVQEGDIWRWYLADLRSTNGTFIRTKQATLEDGVEVLLGGELVRFVDPGSGPPALVRIAPSTEEERITLTPGTHLIGSDPAVSLDFLRESRFLDPQHLRIQDIKGQWQIVDLSSTNGLWVAITKRTELVSGTSFQIGEQRFGFHVP
jgi:pSer/pThr/pTyr-binding forkhead associated (FHA) protein